MIKRILLAGCLFVPCSVHAQFQVFAGGGYGNGANCNEAFITPSQLSYGGQEYQWLFFPDAESMEIRACSNTQILKRLAKVTAAPLGVARNNSGGMYYASLDNGTLVSFAASGTPAVFPAAGVTGPVGLVVADGALYVADKSAKVAWKIPLPNGPPTKVIENLQGPEGIAFNKILYVADTAGNKIVKRDNLGTITTIAGTGTAGFSGDGGPATAAQLHHPLAITATDDGTVYIADSGNNRVRRVSPSGTISTVLGTGQPNTEKRRPTASDDPLQFPVTGPTGIAAAYIPQGVASFPGIWYAADGTINALAAAEMPPPSGGGGKTPTPAATSTVTATPAPTCFPGCTP